MRRTALTALTGLAAVLLAGCGHSAASPSSSPTNRPHGTVSVLYAGSLVNLMEHDLGPHFDSATGYHYQGVGAGSVELANQVKGKVRRADVFISAAPKVNTSLEGAANGNWVSWYATFAKAPLVIGYNPKSRFAQALRTQPWWQVITRPGFRLGRTDPKLDPKGKLTVTAIEQTAAREHDPALLHLLGSTSGVFPEEELVARLQAGQLDAGFFYSNEATERHIPTISLGPVRLAATYTVTVLAHAPNPAGAVAFVRYLLGSAGRAVLTRHGLTLVGPVLSGPPSAVPTALRGSVGAGP